MTAARLTVQDRGYDGLSFRELAKDVGIKSASIHHYFPSKGDLGSAVAARYTADFLDYLDGLLAERARSEACIRNYTDVFRKTVRNDNRMCLGGIMAAEFRELPEEVRIEVAKFGEANVDWLVKVLSLGEPGGGDAVKAPRARNLRCGRRRATDRPQPWRRDGLRRHHRDLPGKRASALTRLARQPSAK